MKRQQINMQCKVAWIYPEGSKSGRAPGVALNDLACAVLRRQIGRHHSWVLVHTEAVKRNDGTTTAAVRKMRVDSNTAWRAALVRKDIEDFYFHVLRHTREAGLYRPGRRCQR